MTLAVVWKQGKDGSSYADVWTADIKFSGIESASEKLKSLSSVKKCPMTRLTMARATPDAMAAMRAIISRT